MIDPRTGNLLTNDDKIQDAAVHTYTKRLENRPINENLEHIKDAKEALCERLLKVAAANKTPPWEMRHLDKVLKNLKRNKSRDPLGYCNELFRPEVAVDDLKLAILKLMNRIKRITSSQQVWNSATFPACGRGRAHKMILTIIEGCFV